MVYDWVERFLNDNFAGFSAIYILFNTDYYEQKKPWKQILEMNQRYEMVKIGNFDSKRSIEIWSHYFDWYHVKTFIE